MSSKKPRDKGEGGSKRGPLTEREVADTMKRWQEAFESGDQSFFDYFDKNVSLFTLSAPTRVDGREVYRRGFEQFFLGVRRNSQILSPEVRLLGNDSAVMTFHNRIFVKGVSTNIRGTVVFVRDQDGGLKCVHMHNSPLTQPVAQGEIDRTIESLTILEERVASASAMTGTPK
jgi:ketosteroid isomerase-like protein